jgi:hypothetical protein
MGSDLAADGPLRCSPNYGMGVAGHACVRRGPRDLHRTQFEVNPGVSHAAPRL